MRSAIRALAPLLLMAALFADGAAVWGRTPVMPIPTPRQSRATSAPNVGVPRSPLGTPTSKGGQKKSWFPFGKRNKKVRSN
jgi:hypothetical protein